MNDARILVVDDEANIRELLDEILSEEGYEVTTAEDAAHAREARRGCSFDLTLLDIWMPDTDGISLLKEWADSGSLGSVVMMSGHGTVDTAVEATRLGALDFIEKPVSLSQLLRTVSKALAGRKPLRGLTTPVDRDDSLIGKSSAMQQLREQLRAAANYDTQVLLTGEAGSGRTLAACHLVSQSPRANGPFERIDSARLNEADAAAYLGGDAGTGGALGRAAGGALYLADIDRLSPRAQAMLCDCLTQDGRFANEQHDFRVIASAPPGYERDPEFSGELSSLLGAVVIRVPALRDHAEDVPELLRFYVDTFVDGERLPFRRFSIAAQNRLRNYPWPGNIGELQQLVKQMLVLGGGEDIGLEEVEAELTAESIESEPLIKQDLLAMPLREAREHFERAYLKQQLELCGGKVGQLAKRVRMERTHLYRKLRGLGVEFRKPAQDE